MCFVNNIMQCQATQSRMCINLNGKTGPAGSYKTVSNWLVSQSTKELDFPQSDCMVAFDNDQVVGKSWRVSIDNKVKSSCVTSICAVAIDTGSCNFSNEQLKIANHPKNGSLHLPKRPEIPERPRNTGKTCEWFNTCSGEGGGGAFDFNI